MGRGSVAGSYLAEEMRGTEKRWDTKINVCQVAELTHRLAHLAKYKGHLRGIPQINLIKNCVYHSVLEKCTGKGRRRRKPGVKYQN